MKQGSNKPKKGKVGPLRGVGLYIEGKVNLEKFSVENSAYLWKSIHVEFCRPQLTI